MIVSRASTPGHQLPGINASRVAFAPVIQAQATLIQAQADQEQYKAGHTAH